MRDFSKISPNIWHSKRFNSLSGDDAKLLMLYLLTCPHLNSAGCFRLPDGYAANDLGWDEERYVKARQSLVDAELIQFDAENDIVLIERWFKHNLPMNTSHAKGVENELQRCPSEELASYCRQELAASYAAKQAAKAESGAANAIVGNSRLATPHLKRTSAPL